jgi:O-acetyl-ADP-ribose deacetylase (regulator of RNase III)
MKISVFTGELTEAPAEAVCTSTNTRLSLMMGTGGAVRERGGSEVARACEAIVAELGPHLPVGSAHVTTAGKLPFRIAIHCVASDASHLSSENVIRACVTNALAKANAAHCTSVAMPVFATGHARVRFERAVSAIAAALDTSATSVEHVIVVVPDGDRADVARHLLITRQA